MKKNDAAKKLLAIYNSYECRKIKLATMLKKKYREGDNFICIHEFEIVEC